MLVVTRVTNIDLGLYATGLTLAPGVSLSTTSLLHQLFYIYVIILFIFFIRRLFIVFKWLIKCILLYGRADPVVLFSQYSREDCTEFCMCGKSKEQQQYIMR